MPQTKRWLLIFAVVLLSIQVLAVVIYVYSFIPLVWDDTFLKGLEPTRDTLFYGVFVAVNIALLVLGVLLVLPRLGSPQAWHGFQFWLCLESFWCFLTLFCFFKWTTYQYPFWNVLPFENRGWLVPFWWVVCVLMFLSKVFFPEIQNFYNRLKVLGHQAAYPRRFIAVLQAAFWVFVIILLYIPNPKDVAALALAWEQWNHLDPVAGWFLSQGWFLSYEQIIQILAGLAMAYIIALFYLVRFWLKSWLLAAVGSLLVLKMGLFYYGSVPCIWTNPSQTFLAHGWDIFLFFGLWFISVHQAKKFYPAAALAGVALIIAWIKSNGYLNAFGLDNQPLMAPLRVRQFFPFFMGFFVPVFYTFSLLLLGGAKDEAQAGPRRFPQALCVYGLMIFTDYLAHPLIGFYGSLIVPAVLVMLWWLNEICSSLKLYVRRGIYAGLLLLTIGALMTNRLMLAYPNLIFQNKDRFARERDFYEHFDMIGQSASLISQLTAENQKVVLLSNFETALLMKAHRQPLFKQVPVMFSGFANNPGGLDLLTKKQGLDLVNSISEENAMYVFVDVRLLGLTPKDLGENGLKPVLNEIKDHYTPFKQQGFLVALQRK